MRRSNRASAQQQKSYKFDSDGSDEEGAEQEAEDAQKKMQVAGARPDGTVDMLPPIKVAVD